MKKLIIGLCGVVLCIAVGCRDSSSSHGHSHDGENAHSHGDSPETPHGGTPVNIADDKFHLELVLDSTASKLQAYVLDGHLEGYVPVAETAFILLAKSASATQELAFKRVSNPDASAPPEKYYLFEAQADWLKTAKEFEGSIPTITLNGATFSNIAFPFPKGSKHVH